MHQPDAVADDGGHTILVVEDDEAVRSLVVEVLQSYNYNVIEAETGDAAIERWHGCMEEVDLLLTDMVMPGEANGLDVARHCTASKPTLKVIYTSGYSSELVRQRRAARGRGELPAETLLFRQSSPRSSATRSIPRPAGLRCRKWSERTASGGRDFH